MTPPRGVEDAAPYNTIRRVSHYRKRPRRPGGRPPYIPLYHIPWGGPSPATHSRHPVGAGHARPATLPLPPRILCIVGRGLDPSAGVGDAAPYNTIRRASHYRKRPRRPGGRPPYIPLYHIPWGGPSSATHSRHPVGAGHARPAASPLPPRILCIVGRQATGPLHNRPAPSNTKITCPRPLAGRLFF